MLPLGITLTDGANPPQALVSGASGNVTAGNLISVALTSTAGIERADFQLLAFNAPVNNITFTWLQGERNLWQFVLPASVVSSNTNIELAIALCVSDGIAREDAVVYPLLTSNSLSGFTPVQVGAAPGVAPSSVFNGAASIPYISALGAGTGTISVWSSNLAFEQDDQFTFISQTLVGDFEFACRINCTLLPANAQAGINIRESIAGNARCVDFLFSPQSTTNIPPDTQRRDSVQTFARLIGGLAPNQVHGPVSFTETPNPITTFIWLKIARVGVDVGCYWSRDGFVWIPGVSQTGIGGPIYLGSGPGIIGLYVASLSQTVNVNSVFDNLYFGPIRTQHKSSWIGNTYGRRSQGNQGSLQFGNADDGYVTMFTQSMFVDPATGTVITNCLQEEGGENTKLYAANGTIIRTADPAFFWTWQGGNDGACTGDGTSFYIFVHSGGSPGVWRINLAGSQTGQVTFTSTIGAAGITGMACNQAATELYLSDYSNNRILVVQLSTLTELPLRAFPFSQGMPGPITCDVRGALWILSMPVASPMAHKYPPATNVNTGVYAYSAAGAYLSKNILPAAGSFFTHVDINSSIDDIWITDNGTNQDILIYINLASTPTLVLSFGVNTGIYAGATPGLLFDNGAGGWQRFYSVVASRRDAAGNIYVACDGVGSDIRKFTSGGTLIWRIVSEGSDAFGSSGFDAVSGTATSVDVYNQFKHHKLNLTNTSPGSEWADYSYTYNPFAAYAANDLRTSVGAGVPEVRTLGGVKVLFMSASTDVKFFWYRMVGETAVPCGAIQTIAGGPPGTTSLWIDANGNGLRDAGETTTRNSPGGGNGGNTFMLWHVDSAGDIWWALDNYIIHLIYQGNNGAGCPVYSLAGTAYEEFPYPPPFNISAGSGTTIWSIHYDRSADAMYIGGSTPTNPFGTTPGFSGGPGSVIARFDGWYAQRLQPAPEPRYLCVLPSVTAGDGNWFTQKLFDNLDPIYPHFKNFSIPDGGRYFFMIEEFGHVRVFDALVGNWCWSLAPGPEINSTIYLTDTIWARSWLSPSGEYLLAFENTGKRASETLYRWTPNRGQAPSPQQVTQLTAAVGTYLTSPCVRVTWVGAFGFTDGFNVYRRIGIYGTEQRIATTVQACKFIDTSVATTSAIALGQSVLYRVAGVNSQGEGIYSPTAQAQ